MSDSILPETARRPRAAPEMTDNGPDDTRRVGFAIEFDSTRTLNVCTDDVSIIY